MKFIRTLVSVALLGTLVLAGGCAPAVQEPPASDATAMVGTWVDVDDGSTLLISDRWITYQGPDSGDLEVPIRHGVPENGVIGVTIDGWARRDQHPKTEEAEDWAIELVDEVAGTLSYGLDGDTLEIDTAGAPEDFQMLLGTYRRDDTAR